MPERKLSFDCPCCGLPTLEEMAVFGICPICWWEDDGQDDSNADKVRGGPNGKYSRTMARVNFRTHGHMYDQGAGIEVVEHPTEERVSLLKYAHEVLSGIQVLDSTTLTNLIEKDRHSRAQN